MTIGQKFLHILDEWRNGRERYAVNLRDWQHDGEA